jgi:dihydrofolate reductase
MSELMVDVITSLDGYGAAEGWPGFWGMEGPEYFEWMEAEPAGYTVLMGRRTYELMSGFASTGAEDLGPLDLLPKVVFSSTLSEPLGWPNTRLVSGDAVEAVRAMKEEGVTLHTLGSVSLCRALLTAGLVDRYRVVVFPVVNGATGYDNFYAGWPDVRLDLLEHRVFDGRLQMLEYRPTVLDGPPGEGSTA